MANIVRGRGPLILAGTYAAIVLLLLVFALVVRDEFSFCFIPVTYATYPLSFFLSKHWHSGGVPGGILIFVISGGVNAGVLYAVAKLLVRTPAEIVSLGMTSEPIGREGR
ncbi:MAG TPA: hypothetical protein VK593_01930 [Edaphobacter sp.]|nr:hypothetical protein [Edaphobacter sp.]